GVEQQIECLDHRGFADLVGAADHHHPTVGELDLAAGDAPVVGERQPVQSHAALPSPRREPCCSPAPSASRNSRANAPRASSASSPSDRASATSSSTAAAANPPTPRSSNSPSAGSTAMSVCRSQVVRAANRRAYLSRQASSAALSVTLSDPVSANRTT